jgi:hypothetical protein
MDSTDSSISSNSVGNNNHTFAIPNSNVLANRQIDSNIATTEGSSVNNNNNSIPLLRNLTTPVTSRVTKKASLVSKHAGAKFSNKEIDALLSIIEDQKPIGKIGWEQVGNFYNRLYPTKPREEINLRRKFNNLANVRMPTGDPNIPPHVLKAKMIKNLIFEKTEALDMGVNADLTIPPDIEALYEGFDEENVHTDNHNNSSDKVTSSEPTVENETPTLVRRLNPRVNTKKNSYNNTSTDMSEFLKTWIVNDTRKDQIAREELLEQRRLDRIEMREQRRLDDERDQRRIDAMMAQQQQQSNNMMMIMMQLLSSKSNSSTSPHIDNNTHT